VNHRLRSNSTRATAALTLGAFLLSACGGTSDGLDLRLSDGTPRGGAVPVTPAAPATPLPDADADKLLARAPAIKAAADDKLAFALRPRSLPPPRTGKVQQACSPRAGRARFAFAPGAQDRRCRQGAHRAALPARGRRAAGAAAHGDVLAADGGRDLAGRRRQGPAGQAHAAAGAAGAGSAPRPSCSIPRSGSRRPRPTRSRSRPAPPARPATSSTRRSASRSRRRRRAS
jgi:hypothetical protein